MEGGREREGERERERGRERGREGGSRWGTSLAFCSPLRRRPMLRLRWPLLRRKWTPWTWTNVPVYKKRLDRLNHADQAAWVQCADRAARAKERERSYLRVIVIVGDFAIVDLPASAEPLDQLGLERRTRRWNWRGRNQASIAYRNSKSATKQYSTAQKSKICFDRKKEIAT